jgi:hypothetical protein
VTADARPTGRRLTCRKDGQALDPRSPRCPHGDEACKHRTECVVYAAEQDEAPPALRGLLAERRELEAQLAGLEATRPGHDSRGDRHAMKLFALRERLDEVRADIQRLAETPPTTQSRRRKGRNPCRADASS